MFGDIDKRLRDLETLLANLVRVGEVTAVFPDKATARVRFQEKQGVVTAELHVPVRTAHKNKDYAMPDVGEPVLCVFLPRGREAGFILCSFYTKSHTPPVTSGDKRHIAFDDGTWLEYDRAAHRLSGQIKGTLDLKVDGLARVKAAQAIVESLDIQLRKGDGELIPLDGVVTGACICALTGKPHIDKSSIVKASKE
jgi:phage baseplate assembly protein V